MATIKSNFICAIGGYLEKNKKKVLVKSTYEKKYNQLNKGSYLYGGAG